MGIVYRAHDHHRGHDVALKTLQWVDATSLKRFKEEFRALADVAHYNLVTLHELFADREQWFFTMELIRGKDFASYVHLGRSTGTGDLPTGCIDRLRAALMQLSEAVSIIHQAGTLHRDIKPSNVLVTSEGRVVLLDFGLAASLGREGVHHTTGQHVLGTVAYMAPEQAMGRPLQPASDWYSVGVMLYECLTGRLPFTGSAIDIIRAKQDREPPAPSELTSGVPADLDSLSMGLLRREPHLRLTGEEVLARLAAMSRPGVPPKTPTPPVSDSLFGREYHLHCLRTAFDQVRQGQAVLISVRGKSGTGKTTLLRHFLDGLKPDDGIVILTGRCYQQESIQYKAFDSLVDALSRYLARLPADRLDALLPRDMLLLARVFPVLQKLLPAATHRTHSAINPQEIRGRAFRALRELLERLGDRKSLVLVIDDLQWGDIDSAQLFIELLHAPNPPVLLLVAVYRSEDVATSPFLSMFAQSVQSSDVTFNRKDLPVEPLKLQDARELALSLLEGHEECDRLDAELIAKESGGNPLFVHELARHVKEVPGIAAKAPTLQDVLWDRISRLPVHARLVLEVLAVAGRPLAELDAAEAAQLGVDVQASVSLLRVQRLIRRTSEDGLWDTYHDRVRETVAAGLTFATRQMWHRRLSEVLAAKPDVDPELLGAHYLGAGDPQLAGACFEQAGDRAARALAFDRSAELYLRALTLSDRMSIDSHSLTIKLADALANAGRGAQAAVEYLKAAATANSEEGFALRRMAAEQYLRSGHTAEGLDTIRAVLRSAGIYMPRSPGARLVSTLLGRLRLWVRGMHYNETPEQQVPTTSLRRIDACWTVAAGSVMFDWMLWADFHTRHFSLALRAGECHRVLKGLVFEAIYLTLPGARAVSRSQRTLRRADELASRLQTPYSKALVALARAGAAYFCGDWRRTVDSCAEGETLLLENCPGAAFEVDITRILRILALRFSGRVSEMIQLYSSIYKQATERGDLLILKSITTTAEPFAQMACDNADQAYEQVESLRSRLPPNSFYIDHIMSHDALTNLSLYCGNLYLARRHVKELVSGAKASLNHRVQINRVFINDIRGRVALASARDRGDSAEIRSAKRCVAQLAREKTHWASALGRLLGAGIAARQGYAESSARTLQIAAAELDSVEMRLHAMAARRRLGELLGGRTGADLIAEADRFMALQQIRNPARMTGLLAPGYSDEVP